MEPNDFPLSHGQKALWFLQRLRPEAAAWNIAAAARVQGRMDSGRLRRAFERLTERHDALRLSFHDGPVQRLHPRFYPETRLDFGEEEWEEGCLEREAERPFDLERDPLLRVRLLRTGGDDVLLLVIHHLVADLGSLAVIVRELGPLYDGTFDDPAPTPYRAFVERPVAERHWEHWRKRLAGELPVCELPADRPRPAVRSFRGGSRTRRIALELPASRAFPFLLAGLDVLLHRLSGQTDLLVGSPASGRLSRDLDGTVGYLVNPVVLRSDLSGSPTFGQLLEQVRGVVLGALRHQEYPFPLLVERLQPERDPARPPVFQVMLAFQRAHLRGTGDLAAFSLGIAGAEVRTGTLVLESLALERRFCELDLELVAAETSRGLELALAFNADLFEPVTARRLLGHLAALLEAAAADPERRVEELPLLCPAQRQQLLEWNGASGPPPAAMVHELVEEQAARSPDAVAVLFGDERLTFAELNARADRLADRLLALGVRPEACVAVVMERSPDLVVSLLAVLKSGAAYAPLDPDLPPERLASLLEDLNPAVVLPRLPQDTAPGLLPAASRPAVLPESLAYVLYTSGSTGRPKPVGVTHAALAKHVLAMASRLELRAGDRALAFASPAFDVSLEQLLCALVRGAAVVLRGPELWPPADFSRIAGELGLTVAELPTAYWRQWVREASAGPPPNLRLVTAGGEAMPPEDARLWLRGPLAGVRLLNAYGPTEAVITATTLEVDAASASRARAVSLGRPFPGRHARVVDLYGQLQPVGTAGELCLGGGPLARGYLGRPDLTAERFVPDPMAPEPGARLYRTGDLARWLPDGTLEYLGRLDRQVKVRGVRIEPGEIEAALAAHPGVRGAVVALRRDRLVAWWTGDPAAAGELRDHLLKRLPLAMVPALFQRLDELPLTPHGKLDRRGLPDPADPAPADDDGEALPGDGLEQLLAGIFGEVLGRERVGPRDDFFGLGGHSLLAAQVSTRVREALGIDVPLGLLFEEPTVTGLARRLRAPAGLPSAAAVQRVPRGGRLPLSFAQQGLWFLHRLAPGSPAWNMPGAARLPGSTDPAALAARLSAALSEITARHEILRTTFPTAGDEPYQEIGAAVPVPVPVVDLSALPHAEPEARRLAAEERRRPFDLARGPLLRALLLRLGPEEQRLAVVLHHIVADGRSLGVLMRETSAILRGQALPELAVQYADWAEWQRRWPAEKLESLLAWWTGRLAGLAPLELPADRPRPPVQSFRGGLAGIPLPPDLSAAVSALARGRRVTPFLLMLAAWLVLLHRLTGRSDVAVGSPVANRSRPEVEGLVGLFVNNLVLRADLSQARGFGDALERVREAVLSAFSRQDLPFERLVAELAPERDLSRPPLFQVAFSFQEPLPSLDLGAGLRGRILAEHTDTSKFDLALQVDRERLQAEYAADLFDAATVSRWLGHLRELLEEITASPEARISELPLLSRAERHQLLPEWNGASGTPAADAGGPPIGPIEETVAEIWSGVLGIERIGRQRGFFELGGHSLLATRVLSRLNQAFGTDLPLRALFEAPTVAGLALLVSSAGRDRLPMPAFRRVPRGRPLAPSFAQERLWVLDRLLQDRPVYNVFQALDLPLDRDVPLDERALERALAEAARRHETLRTRFAIVRGRPMQVVEPHHPRPLPVVDLRGLPLLLARQEADRLAGEEARRPFDLLRGPLLRIGLLHLGGSSRLLLNLHHIICDGWSLDLLAREVGALYRGQPLPELPFQYADYADWQRRWPAELLDRQLAWWKERLAGLATLEVPTDLPRPPVQTFRGGLVLAALPPDLSARLRRLARERHATLFMLLLAGWQTLLHRITGQEDVAVGAPVANRSWPEIEGLVGFFANTLVLRADLSREPGFAGALERVREAALSAHARQDLPFERLVAELAPERDLSRSPLFQVAFSFQEAPPSLDLGLGGRVLATHTGTAKFDLALQADPERLQAEYAADLFDAATVRRWLGHLRALLEGAADSPEARISELQLLSRVERHQLLLEWNDTGGSPEATIPRLVEEQAARTPEALAVVFGDRQLTYAELNDRADRLADRLLGLGVGGAQPEQCVAVVMERSPDLVVSLLAVLKSGAAYAPLDPELPAERLALLLRHLRPAAVLPQDAMPGLLPAAVSRPAVHPQGLAYILHTSGSTGEPKPVGVSHASLAEHVLAMADRLALSERDRALAFASPAFDVSLEQILTALVRGAAVVLRGPELWPPAELCRIAGELGLTVAELPTAYWRQWTREASSAPPPALRLVTAGGEAMPAEDARRWLRGPLAGVRLLNAYGPTEAVITATVQEVDAGSASRPRAVALGRPLPGRRACVVDLHGQVQPVGAAGELCLGGRALARGYLARPDLTAERFVPDPGSPEPGARLYRTGDLARRLPDGTLEFLGRLDRQVKVRGFRVEPAEVETALRRHRGLREAVVVMRDGRLVGYYVPEPGQEEPSPDQVRAWLRGKLPEPMVPAVFVPLDVLPLNPSGKIDLRALPAPAAGPVAPSAAPCTPLESLVAGVCSEVLGIGEVPRDVSFFDLGGNSLLATQVVNLLQDVLPVELSLRQVLERPTVAHLAEILERERRALPGPEQLAMDEILAELERSL